MKMLSLFSGAGMIDLAASWAGIETVAFCEIEEYPQKILRRRFPNVPIYSDIRELTAEKLKADGISKIDIISGGFPCQDVSTAGKRTGFVDSEGNVTRSGLWGEYARLIRELKPRWIVAENVRGLLSISAAGIRGEDSELYSETWPKWGIVLDGHAMELPMLERHIKDKECSLWPTVTTDTSDRKKKHLQGGTPLTLAVKKNWHTPTVADTFTGNLKSTQQKPGSMHSVNLSQAVNWPTPRAREGNSGSYGCASIERNADRNYLDGVVIKKEEKPGNLNADWVELLMGLPIGWTDINVAKEDIESWQGWPAAINVEQYAYEPPRVIVGQKNRAKRLKALGNGCVPQQVYLVFAAIVEVENEA